MIDFSEENLLPKPKAILDTIIEQKMVTFDFIHRNFITTPSSTLHYHLKQLTQKGFIRKIGSTRGALYAPAT